VAQVRAPPLPGGIGAPRSAPARTLGPLAAGAQPGAAAAVAEAAARGVEPRPGPPPLPRHRAHPRAPAPPGPLPVASQALFDLEATNSELKADLRDLYITGAKEIDVQGGARKAVIVQVRARAAGGPRRGQRRAAGGGARG
jgi:hypothetical protein